MSGGPSEEGGLLGDPGSLNPATLTRASRSLKPPAHIRTTGFSGGNRCNSSDYQRSQELGNGRGPACRADAPGHPAANACLAPQRKRQQPQRIRFRVRVPLRPWHRGPASCWERSHRSSRTIGWFGSVNFLPCGFKKLFAIFT